MQGCGAHETISGYGVNHQEIDASKCQPLLGGIADVPSLQSMCSLLWIQDYLLLLYQALQLALPLERIAELVNVLLILPGHSWFCVGLHQRPTTGI